MEWTIIGGGIQGCTLACYLVEKGNVSPENILIIDPHPSPMENWKHCTGKIGMTYLRSPFVHHLSPSPFSLDHYASSEKYASPFTGRQKKPRLDLFNNHSSAQFTSLGLEASWKQGRVSGVKKQNGAWQLALDSGEIVTTQHTVIAIGLGEQPFWPDWAREIKNHRPRSIFHVFDSGCNPANLRGPVTVIGGGITAAHLSLHLSKIQSNPVTMIHRHPFRIHEFDSDPGWMGQKHMGPFQKVKNLDKRRRMIRVARHKGSIPRHLYRSLKHAEKNRQVTLLSMNTTTVSENSRGSLVLSDENIHHETENVILATGFEQKPPGMDWLAPLIQDENLQCARCGYPAVPDSLEWCDHLYVTGGLAELALGPAARNISGARRGAQRIVDLHC
ncbi:hypothetical protein CR205_17590 [Alteribacter lacisalsi]|uniref:FAD-dependent urate hydroxylase HpyO/Asp monooxygenase CreE-like FAD/NAD(P)-binding domain-containing protein n=1 Tax=Alteribacter lacisalsi TaxID=2045244 RepID=A0A2W0H4U0_9BACI|nr:FAD/NAD(P)-binding protein [Alteribacter lacisalsi]PYZ96177.1 hypothetical protein CR205_17590 [Alteribacter lacisalsi]